MRELKKDKSIIFQEAMYKFLNQEMDRFTPEYAATVLQRVQANADKMIQALEELNAKFLKVIP